MDNQGYKIIIFVCSSGVCVCVFEEWQTENDLLKMSCVQNDILIEGKELKQLDMQRLISKFYLLTEINCLMTCYFKKKKKKIINYQTIVVT